MDIIYILVAALIITGTLVIGKLLIKKINKDMDTTKVDNAVLFITGP